MSDAIDAAVEAATNALQVRYGTFSTSVDKQPWRDCVEVEPLDSVLAIKWDADRLDYVPLHVIRGPIQVRRKPVAGKPDTQGGHDG